MNHEDNKMERVLSLSCFLERVLKDSLAKIDRTMVHQRKRNLRSFDHTKQEVNKSELAPSLIKYGKFVGIICKNYIIELVLSIENEYLHFQQTVFLFTLNPKGFMLE